MKYIFPDFFGNWMAKIDMKTQYEGSLIGFTLMIFSLLGFGVYKTFFTTETIGWKVYFLFNTLCGLLILWSFLVTTYQQYLNYLDVKAFVNAGENILNDHKAVVVPAVSVIPNQKLKGGNENEK